jgi:hypothetical protein
MISRAVVNLAITELGSSDPRLYLPAKRYFESSDAAQHIKIAGYPVELLDSAREILQRSTLQRQALAKQLLKELKADSGRPEPM